MNREDELQEQETELTRAQMCADAAGSGWIPLDEVAAHVGRDCEEVLSDFTERYTLGLVHGGSRYAATWYDMFDWLHEQFARRWDSSSDEAHMEIALLIERGLSESSAAEKARHAYVNQQASLSIGLQIGIHTLADTTHLHEPRRSSASMEPANLSATAFPIIHESRTPSWRPSGDSQSAGKVGTIGSDPRVVAPAAHGDPRRPTVAHRQADPGRLAPRDAQPGERPVDRGSAIILSLKTLGGIQTELDSEVIGAEGSPLPGCMPWARWPGFGGGGLHGDNALERAFLGGRIFSGRAAGLTLPQSL